MSMGPKMEKMQLAVRFTPTTIVITNNQTTTWTKCQLEMNATITKKGYVVTKESLPTHTTETISLSEFVRGSTVFNAQTTKAQNFMIMCDTDGVRGWNYFTNR